MTKKHPLSKEKFRLYTVIGDMRRRCYSPDNPYYKNYGGRGISVCYEWLKSPGSFVRWALSNGYKIGLSIDRKNNNKGYSPENCRFVSQKENNRNMITSKRWIINGKLFNSCRQAGRVMGVDGKTIRYWCGDTKDSKYPVPLCYNFKLYR
ncbi:MAG: hypothetical protein GY820_39245 [Gammaproteobacteria bacterium]|nr:hypothetical protein [Gammaproteobacteria bacterium]